MCEFIEALILFASLKLCAIELLWLLITSAEVLADSLASILVLPLYVTLVVSLLAMLSKTFLLAGVVSPRSTSPLLW